MRKKTLCVFAAVQVIGEGCQWSWSSTQSAIGPVLWGGAFFLLLPGNFVGGCLIEKALWRSGLSILTMQLLQAPVALGINLAVWALVAWVWRYFAAKFRRLAGNPDV
jgi:hypothetical protein